MHDADAPLRGEAARLVAGACSGHPAPRILEAGCGARSRIVLPADARVIALDVSRAQLCRHEGVGARVEADVTRLPLDAASVNGVVSWDVLEHVDDPARALAEYRRVLRPGGVIVLGLPHVLSLKGVITRATPWWVHVWVYRRVLGDATAGTARSDQFPTTMRLVLRPAGLRRLARALGLDILLLQAYEGPVPRHFRRRHPLGGLLLGAVGALSRAVSLGRYDATASDLVVVLRAATEDARGAGGHGS